MRTYKHIKTGKKYIKLLSSKIKIDGIWKETIIYCCLYYNKDGMIWSRLKEDFNLNFK